MKIECHCGALIVDQTDNLPGKAHIVPDEDFDRLMEAIDDAIEKSGPSAKEKEAAAMNVRGLFASVAILAWQCRHCGRLYVDAAKQPLHQFLPASDDVPRELLRRKA